MHNVLYLDHAKDFIVGEYVPTPETSHEINGYTLQGLDRLQVINSKACTYSVHANA